MKNKKAALDISFNWIFVLIAGGAILLFFIAIINTQKDKAESNIALTIKTELKSVFSSALLSPNRQLDLDFPQINLKFNCEFATCTDFSNSNNPSCYSQYGIGDTGINEQTPSQIIFAPSEISTKKLLTWTKQWNMPFFVTNFLYVSGTDSKYLFIDSDDTSALEFFNEFPDKMNKELISLDSISSLEAAGSRNFKFVFFNTDPSALKLPESVLSATEPFKINAVNINPSLEQIDFYYLNNDKFVLADSVNYLTSTEVFAAIFADNVDFYKCNMQKAFNRYHILASVLKQRSNLLYSSYVSDSCQSIYAEHNNGLKIIEENTLIFSSENINKLSQAISTLQYANQAAKEKSCPTIY